MSGIPPANDWGSPGRRMVLEESFLTVPLIPQLVPRLLGDFSLSGDRYTPFFFLSFRRKFIHSC